MDQAEPGKGAGYRAALLAVIILSTLLLLAVLAVAAGFVRQYRLMSHKGGGAVPAAGPAATLTLAPGARILSVQADAGRLVLGVQTAKGEEIDILDLASGKLTARVVAPAR